MVNKKSSKPSHQPMPKWALIVSSVVAGIIIVIVSFMAYSAIFGAWKFNDPKYRKVTKSETYKPAKTESSKDDVDSEQSKITEQQIRDIDWNKFKEETHTVSVPLETGTYNGINEKIEYNFDIQVPNLWTDLRKSGLNQYQFGTEGSKGDTIVDVWSLSTYYDNGERDFGFYTPKEMLEQYLKGQNVDQPIYEKEINGKKVNFSMAHVPKYNKSIITYTMEVVKDGTPSVIYFNVINPINSPVKSQLKAVEQVENLISKIDLPQK